MSRRRCIIVGGGPAGLALALELAKCDYDIEVHTEPRQAAGVGIVLDEDAIALLGRIDPECARQVLGACRSWDAVHLRIADERIVSGGHHIRGVARNELVDALSRRATATGVRLVAGHAEVLATESGCDLLVGADGAGSAVRRASAGEFGSTVTTGQTRFLWMRCAGQLDAGFSFIATRHGAFAAHVYPYSERFSAIVVESRPECLASAGLLHADPSTAERSLTEIFRRHLPIDALRAVTFPWQPFLTVDNQRWHVGNRVLIGDAAHTAHFSVGSGTKLAMEDAVALAAELGGEPDLEAAISRYEAERRRVVAMVQADARSSELWFADLGRHLRLPPHQLAFALRTRREVNGYAWLEQRDPPFVARLDSALRMDSRFPAQSPVTPGQQAPEPRLLPLRLGGTVIPHRGAIVADGDGAAASGDAGLVLHPAGTRLPRGGAARKAVPAGLIVPVPCELPKLAGQGASCLLLTGRWPQVRDALADLRRRAEVQVAEPAAVGVLLDLDSWDDGQAGTLSGLADFVAVPLAADGQRVERTLTAERLRNEHGLTVLLWTSRLDADEANTLIAAGRADGYVLSRETVTR